SATFSSCYRYCCLFQEEDGIRAFGMSRVLGEVDKRKVSASYASCESLTDNNQTYRYFPLAFKKSQPIAKYGFSPSRF
ncbi:hypothetical protein, partial [Bacillus sp. S1-R2T1-FB]|uniref:hypothetical protein n=1 Tax=Bacillus sp. S1-R2T1-FB TaxID=1973493 RepID=UPI001C4F144E